MSSASMLLLLVSAMVVFAGVRVRALVPAHWHRTAGRWIGPQLQFTPASYEYELADGRTYSGVSRIRVAFRAPSGGSCTVAYDPADPARSHPAQFRTQGTLLIWVGACAAVCAIGFLVLSLR